MAARRSSTSWAACTVAALLVYGATLISARDPSLPALGTGLPSCLLPIKLMRCTVDNRSRFVAGIAQSYGKGMGYLDACTSGIFTDQQTSWNMADTNSTSFPKNPDGTPNMAYYFPPGGLITQMIVLAAPNPWGNSYGKIPAIIFGYLEPVTLQLNFAVCGNADYAAFYLNPAAAPPPPTPVTLQASYVSPLSETQDSFLGSFGAKCSVLALGSNYLMGDPNRSSIYRILAIKDVCFAPLNHIVQWLPTPQPQPTFDVDYSWWNTINWQPCAYNKKTAHKSASVSCITSGQVIGTGKYGAILLDKDAQPYEYQPGKDGKLVRVSSSGASYAGGEAADAPTEPSSNTRQGAVGASSGGGRAKPAVSRSTPGSTGLGGLLQALARGR